MGEISIIGVNTDLMKEAGLWENERPVPIPDFADDGFFGWFEQLNEASPGGGHLQIYQRPFLLYNYCTGIIAMKGTCFAEGDEGFDVSSDEAKLWLSMLQQLYSDGSAVYSASMDDGYALWKTGSIGSFNAAQGHIMELATITEDESDIAYLGWPGAEDNGSIVWVHSVSIPKVATDNSKVLARAFISEQVFSDFFQQWSFNNYGKMPVLKSAYGEGITRFQSEMPTLLAIADNSMSIPAWEDSEEYMVIAQNVVG